MYCTIQDIVDDISSKTLCEVSNDVDASDIVNEVIVNAKILECSTLIESYLYGRYTLPITDPNSLIIIKPICVSLTVCALYQRRLGLDYPPSLEVRKKFAIADLEKLQKGTIKLYNPVVESTTTSTSFKVSQKTKIFTNDLLSNY